MSLDHVLSVAELITRLELKYILPLEALPSFLDRLPHTLAALDIDRRRIFSYESVYFDTDSFTLYRHHVQGRRKRYKTRTRSYCDTVDTMFEVKLKGRRDQSVKERLRYDFHASRRADLRRPCVSRYGDRTCVWIHGAGPSACPDHHLPPRDARGP